MDKPDLKQLQDQQVIRDVLARYCEAIDEFNVDAVVELFIADCITDYGPGKGGARRSGAVAEAA